MGIKKFSNKYRCYAVDLDGKHHQEYFDTKEEAQARYEEINAGKHYGRRYQKKHNAMNQDLPVGLHISYKTRHTTHGIVYKDYHVKAVAVIDGKVISKQSGIGRRSREDAIAICLKWRNEQLKIIDRQEYLKKNPPTSTAIGLKLIGQLNDI